MQRLGLALMLVELAGACGDNAVGLEPTASGIFPSQAFLGRRARVEITGVGTHWDDNTGVDFGDGIAVGTISVAGPTTLFADISVDTSLPGFHDVTITDGDETYVLHDAFFLTSPLALHLQGNLAQGSVGLFSIINHDFDAPFDTSSFQETPFDAPVFVNLAIGAPRGVTFAIDEVTPYTITGQVLVDVDAAGTGSILVSSGPPNDQVRSPLGASITITPRTPHAFDAPTVSRDLAMAFDSHLYAYTPSATPHVARFAATGPMGTSPRMAILPESGHFADALATSALRATEIAIDHAATYYVIYYDPRGAAGYRYTMAATSASLSELAEAEPNDAPGAAQAHALPALVTGGSLASQADEDWIAFEVGAADLGKRVHVITTSTDVMTDTLVDVRGPSLASLGGPSSDNNFHEDFTSAPLTATGTHYVVVGASQSVFFDPAHNTYVAAIFLE